MGFYMLFARGARLSAASLRIVASRPKLLVFPYLSMASSLLVLVLAPVSILGSIVYVVVAQPGPVATALDSAANAGAGVALFVALSLVILVVAVVFVLSLLWMTVLTTTQAFFDAALVHGSAQALSGRDVSIRESIRAAWDVKGTLVLRAVSMAVLAALGLPLLGGNPKALFRLPRMGSRFRPLRPVIVAARLLLSPLWLCWRVLRRALGPLRRAIDWVYEVSSADVTSHFVVPVAVLSRDDDTDPFRESIRTYRDTWGIRDGHRDSLLYDVGHKDFLFPTMVAPLLLLIPGLMLGDDTVIVASLIGLVLLYALVVIPLIRTLEWIVWVALYHYAEHGAPPPPFEELDFAAPFE